MDYQKRTTERDWLKRLPMALRREVFGPMVSKDYKAEEVICPKGERLKGLFRLKGGRIKFSSATSNSKKMTIGIRSAPYVFGEAFLISNQRMLWSVAAVGDVQIDLLKRCDFDRFRKESPEFNKLLLQITSRDVVDLARAFDRTITLSLDQRLASRLLTLAEVTGETSHNEDGQIAVCLSQSELASLLSASRQSINKLLKRMEADGIIELTYRSILLLDQARLLSIAKRRSTSES